MVTDAEFDQYVADRGGALVVAARALLGSGRRDAEDCVQEALIRVYGRRRHIADASKLHAYALTVLRHLVARHTKRAATEIPTTGIVTVDAADRGGQISERLYSALLSLPRGEREVVLCRFLLDMPVAETAQVLGCSSGTVKSQTSRALAALNELLASNISRG